MDCSELRILFAGNPAISVPSLKALTESFTVVGVLTNPDRPSGRGKRLEAPPVKTAALELGLPVLQYERLLRRSREEVAVLQPNLLVSFACGHYFGPKFLSLFPIAAINIHPSLLPLYRGCAPIQCALLNGDKQTGITVQHIVAEVDCGNILNNVIIDLDGTETTESLTSIVAERSAPLIVSTLRAMCAGTLTEREQDNKAATYSAMLSKQDGIIDWSRPADEIHRKVRAFYPWPKTSTTFNGVPLILSSVYGSVSEAGTEHVPLGTIAGTVIGIDKKKGLTIACGDGLLYVQRLQLSMKKEMDSLSFVNGNPNIIGSVLGN
jgi:methionyl-tRNA formyltransferase